MKTRYIGELEELVLLTVGSLYDQAYAVTILETIKESNNRIIDVTAIHSVLLRLFSFDMAISNRMLDSFPISSKIADT